MDLLCIEAISAVVVSSDNQFIVSSSKDHTIKVSKLEVKKEIKEINLSLHAEEKSKAVTLDSLWANLMYKQISWEWTRCVINV